MNALNIPRSKVVGELISISTLKHLTPSGSRQARELADWRASQRPAPWLMADQTPTNDQDDDTWMLSYMDIMTLLLTLFVMILAYFKMSTETIATQSTKESTSAQAAQHFAAAATQTNTPHYLVTVAAQTEAPQENAPKTRDFSRLTMPHTWFTWRSASQTEIPLAPTDEPSTTHTKRAMTLPNRTETLRAELQSMALGENIDVTEVANTLRIDLANDVVFTLGSTELQQRGQEVLERLAAMLARNDYLVAIEGHTDNLPIRTAQFPSNWELSTNRATHVARYLIAQGIDPQRISAVGYADTQPRFSNDTAEGRIKNRRVTFVMRMPSDSITRANLSQ